MVPGLTFQEYFDFDRIKVCRQKYRDKILRKGTPKGAGGKLKNKTKNKKLLTI